MRYLAPVVSLLILSAAVLTAPARGDDDPTIRIEMKDGVVSPSPVQVPAKKRFRLEVSNTGKTPAEFESKDLHKEKVVAPGTTAVIVFRPIDAGEYVFFDEFHEKSSSTKLIAK
jgi:hypothetical protein